MALLSSTPLGPLLDIPVFASESLGVVEKSVALADDVLDVTQDTVDQLKTEKSNLDEVVSEFGSLIDQANGELSSGLDSIKSSVYEQGQNLNNLKRYQMESKMIGGRINKSKNEFLYLQKQQSKKTRRNKYR